MTVNETLDSDEKLDAIFVDLFIAFSSLNRKSDTQMFLSDLVSKRELKYLANRLRIAMLLSCGYSYEQIREMTGTAFSTIASVSKWLKLRGHGYHLAMIKLAAAGKLPALRSETSFGVCNEEKVALPTHGKYGEVFWPVDIVAAVVKGIARPKKR